MLCKNINTNNKKQQYFQEHLLSQRMRILVLLEKLSKLPSKAVVLHSYSEHCTSFVPNYKPPAMDHQNEQNFQILCEIYIQKII